MSAKSLVVLTRPDGRNEALAQRLHAQHIPVLSAPLLTVRLHPQAVHHWSDPDAYQLIIFVSGYAARCYLQCWQQRLRCGPPSWPAHTLAATVGAASAQPLLEAGVVPAAQVIHPPFDAAQDSESLWRLLQNRLTQTQTQTQTRAGSSPADLSGRVLIVGAAQGRDWLAQRLHAHGCQVQRYVVYERQAAVWPQATAAVLRRPIAASPIVLLTSTQATQALDANLHRWALTRLYAQTRFVLIHPRIAVPLEHLAKQAGCRGGLDVSCCAPDDAAMFQTLMALQKNPPNPPVQTATITP